MRWLPRIGVARSCIWGDAFEAEGVVVTLRWGRLVLEQFVGRIDRTFEHEEDHHEIV